MGSTIVNWKFGQWIFCLLWPVAFNSGGRGFHHLRCLTVLNSLVYNILCLASTCVTVEGQMPHVWMCMRWFIKRGVRPQSKEHHETWAESFVVDDVVHKSLSLIIWKQAPSPDFYFKWRWDYSWKRVQGSSNGRPRVVACKSWVKRGAGVWESPAWLEVGLK